MEVIQSSCLEGSDPGEVEVSFNFTGVSRSCEGVGEFGKASVCSKNDAHSLG